MSAAATRIPSTEAGPVASRFKALIAPYCERVEIAGSLRRRLPTVGDIEIVAVPRVETVETVTSDLFGESAKVEQIDRLHEFLERALADGIVSKRPRSDGLTFWGPKAKYMTFEGIPLDLFTPEADRFGIILAIRTGPAMWSKRLVSPDDEQVQVGKLGNGRPVMKRGLMPRRFRVQDGWLTSRVSGERIPTPEESDVFSLLGLEWVEPHQRS